MYLIGVTKGKQEVMRKIPQLMYFFCLNKKQIDAIHSKMDTPDSQWMFCLNRLTDNVILGLPKELEGITKPKI